MVPMTQSPLDLACRMISGFYDILTSLLLIVKIEIRKVRSQDAILAKAARESEELGCHFSYGRKVRVPF